MKKNETANSDKTIWVIRAGVQGNAEDHFMKKKVVLEDPGLGDLSKIDPNRPSFYEAYKAIRPDEMKTAISGIGGKFFRFVHEIKRGDIIVYPSIRDKQVYIGEITGDYQFVRNETKFPHQREVSWIGMVPKSSLSKPAQFELGAARTLFKYQKHAAEILNKIKISRSV